MSDLPALMSVEAMGKYTGLARAAAYEAVRTGVIPSIRVGRRIFVPRAKLLELLGERDPENVMSPGRDIPGSSKAVAGGRHAQE